MIDDLVLKIVTTLGVPGLGLFLVYKLLDKYAAKFVEHAGRFADATIRQAQSTADLVNTVRQSSDAQRDLLLAIRVVSRDVSEVREWVKEIDGRLETPKKAVAA